MNQLNMYRTAPCAACRFLASGMLTLCLAVMSGCASTQKEAEVSPPTGLNADSAAALQETAQTTTDAAVRARTYLQLAMWHASHANSERNYSQALKEFELYVSLAPGNEVPSVVRDWIAALRELERAAQEADRAGDDLRKAKQRAAQLSRENRDLKDALERLKALDLKMEEKRRQVK